MALKVTFYNDVNFAGDDTSNGYVFNKRTQPAAGNFSDGGIYFTSYNDITKNQAPAHIIQKSYIYTLGSYVVNNPTVEELRITSPSNTRTSNELSENDCYVVTDIESDPYNKLLTVKKTNIKLGQIVDVASHAATFMANLASESKTINLGSYSLTVSISPRGELTLSNSKLLADEIEYTYQKGNDESGIFGPGDTFNLSEYPYTLQFTTKTYIASAYITCPDANNITFGKTGIELSCAYHKNNGSISYNVVKVSIPTSGWDASTYTANSYIFSVYINTTGGTKDDIKYNSGEWNVNLTISKTPSPLTLTPRGINVTNQIKDVSTLFNVANDTDPGLTNKLTWEMTKMIASEQDVKDKDNWGRFYPNNQQYEMGSAYEMKKAEINVNCYYQCMVNTYSIYHQTKKQCTLRIGGGKQWTVNLNANGGTVDSPTVKNYYEGNLTLPTPTRDSTSSATYTFNGWHTAATGGTQVSSPLKAGGTNVTWNNHEVTLYAQWTETATTKYYWYVGTEKLTSDSEVESKGVQISSSSQITNPLTWTSSDYVYFIYPTSFGTAKIVDEGGDDAGGKAIESLSGVSFTKYKGWRFNKENQGIKYSVTFVK